MIRRSRTAERPIPTESSFCRAAFALVAITRTSLAAAEPPSPNASLVVTRGDGAQDCPDSTRLAEQVRALAGTDVVSPGLGDAATKTRLQVAITRTFSAYAAQISASGARHGTRVLEDLGPNCESLSDAVAVSIAIFLDPYAALEAAPRMPPPLPPTPPHSSVVPKPESQHRQPFFLDAATGIALDLFPHGKPFLSANVGWQADTRWSFALGGSFVFPDRVSVEEGSVSLSLSYGFLRACGRALGEPGNAWLAWCLTPQLGSIGGHGSGFRSTHSAHATWLALAMGPRVVFPLTRTFAWVFGADVLAPMIRRGFDVQTMGARSAAFQSPSVGGQIALGLEGSL